MISPPGSAAVPVQAAAAAAADEAILLPVNRLVPPAILVHVANELAVIAIATTRAKRVIGARAAVVAVAVVGVGAGAALACNTTTL